MSKWALLVLSVAAVVFAIYVSRRVEDIRRQPTDAPNANPQLMHMPLPQRAERAESMKMSFPERGLAAAVGLAIALILMTVNAFFG